MGSPSTPPHSPHLILLSQLVQPLEVVDAAHVGDEPVGAALPCGRGEGTQGLIESGWQRVPRAISSDEATREDSFVTTHALLPPATPSPQATNLT